jgi:hypothetical protein
VPKSSGAIPVAIIGAVASIVGSLLSSNVLTKATVRESVSALKIVDVDVWEQKSPNVKYTAERGGVVIAVASATTSHRHVPITGFIGEELIAASAAQDSTVVGVPSIGSNSFAMPVPKGESWIVKVPDAAASQVRIRWFTTKAELRTQP